MKNQVNRAVNSGQDAKDPEEFAKCATKDGGVVNTTIMIGTLIDKENPIDTATASDEINKKEEEEEEATATSKGKKKKDKAPSIPGMTYFNHIEFEEDGIKVNKHSTIGAGKFIPLKPCEMTMDLTYEVFPSGTDGPKRTFKPFRKGGTIEPIQEENMTEEEAELSGENESPPDVKVQCNNNFCDATFDTFQDRDKHFHEGACSLTVYETVSKMWTAQFSIDMFETLTPQQKRSMATFLTPLELARVTDTERRADLDFNSNFEEGFALKQSKDRKSFTSDQLNFVKSAFDQGEVSKSRKVKPEEVVARMRRVKVKDDEGQEVFLFSKKDWLSETQVRSLFGRFARERNTKGKKATVNANDEEYLQECANEYRNEEFKQEVISMTEVANEDKPLDEQEHPFTVSYLS